LAIWSRCAGGGCVGECAGWVLLELVGGLLFSWANCADADHSRVVGPQQRRRCGHHPREPWAPCRHTEGDRAVAGKHTRGKRRGSPRRVALARRTAHAPRVAAAASGRRQPERKATPARWARQGLRPKGPPPTARHTPTHRPGPPLGGTGLPPWPLGTLAVDPPAVGARRRRPRHPRHGLCSRGGEAHPPRASAQPRPALMAL